MVDASELEIGETVADESGKQWVVYARCHEPTVFIEELDAENKVQMAAGITGRMWQRMSRVQ